MFVIDVTKTCEISSCQKTTQRYIPEGYHIIQGVSLAIGPKVFLITFKVIDVI
jgi:hypothetical protein